MGATAPSRPLGWLLALSVIAAATPIGGCGEQGSTAAAGAARPGIPASRTKAAATQDPNTGTTETVSSRVSLAPAVTPAARVGAAWTPVATVAGGVAASEAARSGVTLLRFDQSLVKLALHAGSGEPSGSWKYGDRIEPSEIHRVIAAFNGGFKFGTGRRGIHVRRTDGGSPSSRSRLDSHLPGRDHRDRHVGSRRSGSWPAHRLGAPEPQPARRPRAGGGER